jgi:signal transduction histidine kinase
MDNPNRKIKVLNVNDDEGARYMTTLMLRRAGFEVVEAVNGADALRASAEVEPDVLVLDIKLPDIDGFEVCRRIKRAPETAAIKVLATSATFVSLETKLQTLEVGADGYLAQPFERPELIATINALARLSQTESSLRQRAEELQEADRRKDEMLAMLGHELRNPLAAIASSLPMIERQAPLDERDERARQIVQRQVQHLSRLVDDLLDVARVTHGRIELRQDQLDVGALLSRVAGSVRSTKMDPRTQNLELRLPEEPVYVRADAMRLEQVFWNLLDNASKYSEKNGHIKVEVLSDPPGDGERMVRVRVSDDGAGISPELLFSVFDLFYQSKVTVDRSRGGLGIGLTLVRRLVEQHGGKVSAKSEGLGHGSTFEVALPLFEDNKRAVRERSSSKISKAQLPAKRRVLIVEDNEDAGRSLADLLEVLGHEVHLAADGIAGVQQAIEVRPDICLVDIGLPGIDGYELARRVRATPEGRDIFLVALTGYGTPDNVTESSNAGFDLHLVKPIDLAGLEQVMK